MATRCMRMDASASDGSSLSLKHFARFFLVPEGRCTDPASPTSDPLKSSSPEVQALATANRRPGVGNEVARSVLKPTNSVASFQFTCEMIAILFPVLTRPSTTRCKSNEPHCRSAPQASPSAAEPVLVRRPPSFRV